jgi:hypothetical protein
MAHGGSAWAAVVEPDWEDNLPRLPATNASIREGATLEGGGGCWRKGKGNDTSSQPCHAGSVLGARQPWWP